jgi:hypothetical protein
MKARDFVCEMWRKTGAVGDEPDQPTGRQGITGLSTLNHALALMNSDGLFFHTETMASCGSSGQEYITIGNSPTADINVQRPSKISAVYYRYTNSAPIKLDQVAFRDIYNYKTSPQSIGAPMVFAYQPEWPIAKIHFNMVPISNASLIVIYNYMLPQVALDDEMDLPPEYFGAITWLGAFLLAQREGMEEIDLCKAEFEREKELIRNTNFNNTPITTVIMNTGRATARHNMISG